jgi:hypothetical protein
MDNLNELQNLLNQVENIVKKYDDLALQSGEKFNVFDIIGIRNDEVRMHSAMLANLLDAQGSHGMKGKFLELFIKMLEEKKSLDKKNNFKDYSLDFAIDSSYCIKEEHNYENGRIDLVIKKGNGECPFLIENKINAKEQVKQLIKYNNAYPTAKIIYLTLFGDTPSTHIDKDGTDISEKVYCISYKTDILNWLDLCHKEASDKPLIREGIKHYINLIKIITNQNLTLNMEKEIKKIVNEHIELVYELNKCYDLINDPHFIITFNFFKKLYNKLNINYNEGEYEFNKNLGKSYSNQTFFKHKKIEFYFYFDSKLNELYFYINSSNDVYSAIKSEFITQFEKVISLKNESDFVDNKDKQNPLLFYKVNEYNNNYWSDFDKLDINELAFRIEKLIDFSKKL